MVLPDSHEVSRASRYSGTVHAAFDTTYGTFTLYGQVSQLVLLSSCGSIMTALQPRMVETTRFGLFPFRSPLLRESRLISSPSGTEMFHFPEFASIDLCIRSKDNSCRVSPFGHLRIKACLAAPQRISLPTTSFIASWRQGIHQMPLNAFNFCSSLTLFNCQRT